MLLLFRPKLTTAGAVGPYNNRGYDDKKKKLLKRIEKEVHKLDNIFPELPRGEILDLAKAIVIAQLDMLAEYEQAVLLFMVLDDEG